MTAARKPRIVTPTPAQALTAALAHMADLAAVVDREADAEWAAMAAGHGDHDRLRRLSAAGVTISVARRALAPAVRELS